MSTKLSKLYGMDIFSDSGKYLGKVYDIIIDVEKGEVVRLTLESVQAASRDEAQRIIRERTILYKNVKSVEDVIVVGRGSGGAEYPGYGGAPAREEHQESLSFLSQR
jgi:sporulation protein YlmC with PRC-barrel domain